MKIKRFAALLATCLACTPALSAEPTIQAVTFKHPDGRTAPAEIYIDGEITPSLPRQLAASLASNRIERGTIYLNSVGGDLQAGMELGEFIRKTGFNTAIGKRGGGYGKPAPGSCQSACLMTFAGGVYRFAEPRTFFGIHRFYARTSGAQDLALGQVISAAITGYLLRMGVSPSLFEKMVNAGASPQKLPVEEALSLNLVNNGVLPVNWSIEGKGGKVYLQGEQKTWNGTGRLRVACSRSDVMTITAQYNADQNTQKIKADAKHLSLRLNGGFVGIASEALVRPTSLSDGFLTTTFRASQNVSYELSRARSIGFAWLPAETSIFYGFDLSTAQHSDMVYSFIQHCAGR
ncbi:COG3904 family protein [Pseudomonas putida]|uniref:Periplasmic protein n=1 Tax=Pseudomonas putida TaxID=303 RepID=A0A7V8EFS9_PSEPU|nr:hypothetical protein [Pseudomonas putida]KAF0254025.1 hypothetical protein GN299_15250 [Pseudomonas putida]